MDCTSLPSITLPTNLVSLGQSAFYNCRALSSITIPDSVTTIDSTCFRNCQNLTSVSFSSNSHSSNSQLTTIKAYAFRGCISLEMIILPSTVTSLGNEIFLGCTNLSNITVRATIPPTLGTDAFLDITNFTIYVPEDSVELYKTASGWSNYADKIQAEPTADFGDEEPGGILEIPTWGDLT